MRLRQTKEPGHPFFFLAPTLSTGLCLILFLLMGGALLLQPGIAVKVPQAPFLLVPHHDPYVVSITGSPLPSIFFDNQELSLEELHQKLIAHDTHGSLIIKADHQAPYDLLVQVVTVGINDGFSVILATSEATSSK
jgi:biopolymer transport protein ExbD